MNRTMHWGLSGVAMALMLAACNRHVTIEPELVGTRNQKDWTIVSVPAPPSREPSETTAPSAGQSPPVAPLPEQAVP